MIIVFFLRYFTRSLFDKVDGALEEAVEGLALQHAVLEQSQIDELVDNGVRLGSYG